MNENIFKQDEKALFPLRRLYRSYGYLPFKMNKFEEYDFYLQNKEFLVSDRVITFNDTDGKLLALKPDVTLSIVKNSKDIPGFKQKVYYDENVYRVSGSTHRFREILQTGVECIGDIDLYDLFEAISLAAQSLRVISERYVLQISHLGILSSLLKQASNNDTFILKASKCIAEKNTHDLQKLCLEYEIPDEETCNLCSFVGIYGDRKSVLTCLEPLCKTSEAMEALDVLKALSELLDKTSYSSSIFFDFSIVNDMSYYNGIVFKGFLEGICQGVLSGGQYDNLLRRMNRRSGAVGFALYLDLLEDLPAESDPFDVDVVLLYDEAVSVSDLAERASLLTADGKSVSAQKVVPEKLRYRSLIDLRKES